MPDTPDAPDAIDRLAFDIKNTLRQHCMRENGEIEPMIMKREVTPETATIQAELYDTEFYVVTITRGRRVVDRA